MLNVLGEVLSQPHRIFPSKHIDDSPPSLPRHKPQNADGVITPLVKVIANN